MNFKISRFFILLSFSLFIISYGWVGDDYLITVRTALNFINGYGPVFNIGERVQAYTHPLWFFILSGVFASTKEIFYSTILLSTLISIFSVYIASKSYDLKGARFIAFILFLFFSSTFMDYTSSGLENPLGYLLFAGLIWCFYKNHYFFIPLISALLFLTRQDYVLIFGPILIFCLYTKTLGRDKKFISFTICGCLVLSWLTFTLYYYGSLFPNTYYSKTLDYDSTQKFINAARYYQATLSYDMLALPLILVSLIMAIFRHQSLSFKDRFVTLSVLPYLLYVLWIGGDFMIGRFFAIPFFILTPIFVKVCFYIYANPPLFMRIKLVRMVSLSISISCIVSLCLLNRHTFPINKQIRTLSFEPIPFVWNLVYLTDERSFFVKVPFLKPNLRTQQINRAFDLWKQRDESQCLCDNIGFFGNRWLWLLGRIALVLIL